MVTIRVLTIILHKAHKLDEVLQKLDYGGKQHLSAAHNQTHGDAFSFSNVLEP
ncbi:MAG: hypothetical protein ACJA0G_002290 [Kangiellaceae bacterium]|jgi:hypothetical protein